MKVLQRLDHTRNPFRCHHVILVTEEKNIGAPFLSGTHVTGIMLSPFAASVDQAKAGERVVAHNAGSVVRRAVVGHNDLKWVRDALTRQRI